MDSFPRSGPTDLSSIILSGAGNAPALNKIASSLASCVVKFPDIWPLPVTIASLITGELTTSLSRTIAKYLPIFSLLANANFLEPILSSLKLTTEALLNWSNPGCASIKFSPEIIILFSTMYLAPVLFEDNDSTPREFSFSLFATNRSVNFAVFPNNFFIAVGSFNPGSSTSILSNPLVIIFGSFVPNSSILFLTISIDWSKAFFLIKFKFSSVKNNLIRLFSYKISNSLPPVFILELIDFWFKIWSILFFCFNS